MSSPRCIDALVAEIGSTTTSVTAFDGLEGAAPVVVGQGVAATTVSEGDVGIGLEAARARLEAEAGPLEPAVMLATSSAAGGLRMTVHGLTRKMTAMAAHEAALGAGAVVRYQTAGKLSSHDIAKIDAVSPNLVLLAGGVEDGDTETVLFNARQLAGLSARPMIVYAGNSAVADEVRALLGAAGFAVRVTRNVYPAVDELDILPARRAIHDAFEEHITRAPGMERIGEFVTGRILPTPGAVLLAAELLAEEVGDLVVVDVGGATTDVHSITDGSPEFASMMTEPQPHAKRTVEGDLGTFVSAEHTAALIPEPDRPTPLPPAVPTTPAEIAAAWALARVATVTAMSRHAGRLTHLFTPTGRKTVVHGRDLTACRTVIGTGGALVRLPGGAATLTASLNGSAEQLLPPLDARVALDSDYIFACCGALSAHFPPPAVVALMRASAGI
ncbi:MAG: glutamate mutase L [Coriobacteriales bacterium]|nr:glutamate mutase L [Actinomycetes bacterium]